ncbi:MAG: undecaprenyl-diphosphate phosphatase [Kiritimatiellia bacterium]
MSDFLDVTVLAVLQGVAEFLPISSSGHLVILQSFLDVPEALRMRLEIFLHAGTLASIFLFYARRLAAICAGLVRGERETWLYAARLLASTAPAILVFLLFRDSIEAMVGNVRMVGALLMFTGAVLVGTRYLPHGTRGVNFVRALLMGVGQAVALLPGVSRSGMTLAVARGGRVSSEAAAEFSFLMSAPLILGGVLLELIGDAGPAAEGMHWGLLVWGALLSGVVGYISLALLVRILKGRWFWLFGPYCILAGLLVVCFC